MTIQQQQQTQPPTLVVEESDVPQEDMGLPPFEVNTNSPQLVFDTPSGEVPSPEPTPSAPEPETPSLDVQSLAQELGVSPDQLQPPPVQPFTPANIDYNSDEFKTFNEQFKKYTGADFTTAIQSFNDLQQQHAKITRQTQEQQLASMWGVAVDAPEFQQRMSMVRSHFAKLSPEVQARLDNPKGAYLLYAQLANSTNTVPKFDAGSKSGMKGSKYLYTQAQILSMSQEDYAKNASRIAYAYANNLVYKG